MTTHEDPALPAVTHLDGLARIELGRPAWYCGHIAEVRRLGTHRLLLLREVARDGSALAVWVSSVAIGAERSTSWATLLDAQPLPSLAVHFRGRFPCCSAIDPLTADIHFPEDIGVCRSTRPSSGRARVSTRPVIAGEADGQVVRDGKPPAAGSFRAPAPAPSTDDPFQTVMYQAVGQLPVSYRGSRLSAQCRNAARRAR